MRMTTTMTTRTLRMKMNGRISNIFSFYDHFSLPYLLWMIPTLKLFLPFLKTKRKGIFNFRIIIVLYIFVAFMLFKKKKICAIPHFISHCLSLSYWSASCCVSRPSPIAICLQTSSVLFIFFAPPSVTQPSLASSVHKRSHSLKNWLRKFPPEPESFFI